MTTIARPTTTAEVLRNFKFAFDNALFLRDDFYADENLRKFFAAREITWSEVTPERTSGYVYSQYAVAFFLIHGMIDEKWDVVATGKRQGGGTLNADITADSIIELFGKPDEDNRSVCRTNFGPSCTPVKEDPRTRQFGHRIQV